MSNSADLAKRKREERLARDERLAAALRDNLRRRKDQARARDARAAVIGTSNASGACGLSGDPLSTTSNRHGGTTAD